MISVNTEQSLSDYIDKQMTKMFNPEIVIAENDKLKIKDNTMSLSEDYMEIISAYGQIGNFDKYIDNIFSKIDVFIIKYNAKIDEVNDKHIAASVYLLWTSIFNKAEKDLQNGGEKSGSSFFNYLGQEIDKKFNDILKK